MVEGVLASENEFANAPLPGERGRVLLVEDDGPLRQVCTRVLADFGHSVQSVASGEAALSLVGRDDFDVVVSDVNMPGISGLDVLRAVGAIDSRLPVILMTGAPSTESAVAAVEHRATRYLIKPFQLLDLLGAVGGAVHQRRQHEPRPTTLELIGSGRVVGQDLRLERQFDRALASLHLAFQPIVRWPARDLVAYEALLRTDDSTLRRPPDLLAAAEKLGRVADVGRAVRAWAAVVLDTAAAPPPALFVNLHPQDLLDEHLYDPRAGLSRFAHRVVLELTERAALDGVKDLRARVAALRGLGYRVAIDDLGAGYSGLAMLTSFEPEVVKLDMSLTHEVHLGRVKQRLVELLATLSRESGITVVAEGVETTGERDALVALGCEVQQGFLFGRPSAPFARPLW
jgi:EAL domain-containing protein (putative c-di-GMP-specific phosphodiesterase class I)/ActR/RegA family two-component response regulator